MDDLTECSESAASVVLNTQKCDIFSRGIDIAKSAKRAQDAASKAEEQAKVIERMAVKARAEADGLHVLADTITNMATSVATMGLDSCQYQSYWDAFSQNKAYSDKMEFKDFMDIVGKGSHDRMGMYLSKVQSTSRRRPMLQEQDSIASSVGPSSDSQGSSSSSDYMTCPSTKSSAGMLSSVMRAKLQSRRDSDEMDYPPGKPARQSGAQYRMTPQKSSRRGSVPASLKYNPDTMRLDSFDVTDEESAEKFQEKFPHTPSQNEYKETLASSFDSTSMLPLWEDRYIHGYRNGEVKEEPEKKPINAPKKWSEKKALKQLNIKLHKKDDMEDSSSEERCDHVQRELPGISRTKPKTTIKSDEESYDDEVDEILRTNEPIQMQKIRNMETRPAGQAQVRLSPTLGEEKHPATNRSVSPLLSTTEKEAYTVEEAKHPSSPVPIQKHIFQPTDKSGPAE